MSAITIDTAAEDKVREILANSLDLEGEELTRTGLFVDEYGADSLCAIEMLSALEVAFGVTIEQDELQNMIHFEAVLEVLSRAESR
ncbi:acyl carrier protein [Streptomyces sparsogenes]|uniref:Putative acyl carrier protein n=1 Tax=Streptomyces sparsogenes DSM 40356 TaxID=1331668 RepID=A0A1R1S6M7_9ACTN|nr:acyl carrier protein [Streptomyces sparsogenes]OMI33934.1 putative acyl carrier protein [Streptomyces sparsogenes DSM 40356]